MAEYVVFVDRYSSRIEVAAQPLSAPADGAEADDGCYVQVHALLWEGHFLPLPQSYA